MMVWQRANQLCRRPNEFGHLDFPGFLSRSGDTVHCKCQDYKDTLVYPALRHMNLFWNWDKPSVVLLSATGMWMINLLWCINALDTWLFIEIIILQAISQICTGAGIRGQEGWRNVQQVQHSACGHLCLWSQDKEISVLRTCEQKMSTVCHWWFTAITLF